MFPVKPGSDRLTPDDAAVALRRILASTRTERGVAGLAAPTFAEVAAEWLRHGERERQIKLSTLAGVLRPAPGGTGAHLARCRLRARSDPRAGELVARPACDHQGRSRPLGPARAAERPPAGAAEPARAVHATGRTGLLQRAGGAARRERAASSRGTAKHTGSRRLLARREARATVRVLPARRRPRPVQKSKVAGSDPAGRLVPAETPKSSGERGSSSWHARESCRTRREADSARECRGVLSRRRKARSWPRGNQAEGVSN